MAHQVTIGLAMGRFPLVTQITIVVEAKWESELEDKSAENGNFNPIETYQGNKLPKNLGHICLKILYRVFKPR